MSRLINNYRKCPTPSNRRKLQDYLNRHMMAVCTDNVKLIVLPTKN